MTPRKKSTCWFLWRDKRAPFHAQLVKKLEAAGFACADFQVGKRPDVEELRRSAPEDVAAVFVWESNAEWLADTTLLFQSISPTAVPVFWAGDATKLKGPLLEIGIDDFVAPAEKKAVLSARLELRRRQVAGKIQTDIQFKKQSASLVRSETTLKQREEFLSVCAHDLRSPLGLIQSSLSLVLNPEQGGNQLSPIQEELLSRAKRQAGHALALVGDLLDVMSLEQGLKPQYQLLSLQGLLSDFYKDYRFQAEQKEVTLHYDNLIPKWRILGDAERVRQLLQNLFTNALKFTEKGKNIYLNVSPFRGRRKSDPPFPMIIISVKDEGLGIPEKEMQRIFDRFTQIKKYSRADGRGLGLTVAKQISNLHDGNIWVQSAEGKGSTFFALFPHTISRLSPEASGAHNRILVAEPSQVKRDQYFSALKSWGYEVDFAKDGVEAITMLYHLWPTAVVLTSELGKISAPQVTNILKSDTLASHIPLIWARDEKTAAPKDSENMLVDAVLGLPCTRSAWEKALTEVQQRQYSEPHLKKAA